MRYLKTACACAVAGAALAMTPAWATINYANAPSGTHLANGSFEPSCSVGTTTVTCSGATYGGVGNTNLNLNFEVTYQATVTCTNNGGTTVAVKTQFPETSKQTFRPNTRNGQVTVPEVESTAPTAAEFESATRCPNRNWTKTADMSTMEILGFLYTLRFAGFSADFIVLP